MTGMKEEMSREGPPPHIEVPGGPAALLLPRELVESTFLPILSYLNEK